MRGRRVSSYEIIGELGRGGTGIVYQARDLRLGRIVALKFLSPHLLASAEAGARFLNEARAISSLNHPHIATLYDVGEEEGARFLVLEYLPGGTLRLRLRDLKTAGVQLSCEEITRYALQVAEGLAYAHRHGVIHRDVKSGNVMFSAEGTAKITDFSLAKCPGAGDLTRPGAIVGTLAYMSPEQAQGLEADHRCDVFSLGVVLYEMATGELPFQGPHDAAILREVIETPTPAVAAVRADLPEAFGAIVARATAKDPAERYQSMEELAGELRTLGGGLEPGTASRGSAEPTLSGVTRVPVTRPPPSWWRRVMRRRGVVVAAAAVLAVGLGVPFRERLASWLVPARLPAQRQLVVLPFTNVGGDPANQAFCDGLTETLTARLNQLEQSHLYLRVVPATEVRAAEATSAEKARRKFGVNLALGGGVQRAWGRVRVTLHLVDAERGRGLDSQTVDARLVDISELEDAVFRRAVELLGLAPEYQAGAGLSTGQTRISAAYDLYLQGRGHLVRYDVAENLDRAIRAFQQALQQDANYAPAHAGLGEACCRKYRKTKDPQWIEEARRSCIRALELNRRLGPAYMTLGLIYHDTGRYEEAIVEFQRGLKLNPVDPATYRELARAHAAKGQQKEAIQAYQKAIDLWPNYWAGYTYLGDFHYRNGRDGDAERCFRRAIELEPDSSLAYRNLGGIYLRLGRYEEAARMTQRSQDLNPTAHGSNNLGVIYEFQGRYADAIRMFQQAVAAGSNDRRTWGNLADAYRWASEPGGKAAEAYRQALQLAERDLSVNPRDAEVRAALALYCVGLSDRARASREIERARRQAPDNVNVLFRAALASEQIGRRAAALETLKAALERGYSLAEVQWHPDLASLRQDPRYRSVLASAGMPGSGPQTR